MSVYSKDSDGSVVYWKNLNQMLQGQATSKMTTYQDTIKDTKLVDYPGLNITKYHQVLTTEGRNGLSFGYLLSKLSKMVWFAPYKWTLSSKDHHKLPTPKSNNSLKTLNIRIGQRYVFRSPREEEL